MLLTLTLCAVMLVCCVAGCLVIRNGYEDDG